LVIHARSESVIAGSNTNLYALLGFTSPRYFLVLARAVSVISSVTNELAQGVNETLTGLALGAGAALAAGEGFATGINTPLFQTNFLPLFTQVNVLPALTLLIPALLQELPAFTAAYEFGTTRTREIKTAKNRM
jgi:hypothetical protein